MLWLFVSAFLLGGGLIAMSTLGGGDHDGGDFHVDHDVSHDHGDAGLLAVFSLRNLAWASIAFGGIGLLAVLTNRSSTTQIMSATISGVFTLAAVHTLFRYLQKSGFGDLPSDAHVFGVPAQLVLPFNDAGLGMISFRANGQIHEMPARRASDVENYDSSQFTACRIEYIENGVAVVQPGAE